MNKQSKLKELKVFWKRHRLLVVLAFVLIIFLLSLLPFSRQFMSFTEDKLNLRGVPGITKDYPLNVYFLDVGKADSIIIQLGDEFAMIDTGTVDRKDDIEVMMRKLGVERLEYLFLSHPDSDHTGSASHIISEFEIGEIIQPVIREELIDYEANRELAAALDAAKDKAVPLTYTNSGAYSLGEAEFEILGPINEHFDVNDYSLVIKLIYKNTSILFCGDMEERAELQMIEAGVDLSADVLKAGHHGSRTSTSEDFLRAVNPGHAVLCTGKDSDNLPTAEVLERLEDSGVMMYRTDLDGLVTLSSNGEEIIFTTEK